MVKKKKLILILAVAAAFIAAVCVSLAFILKGNKKVQYNLVDNRTIVLSDETAEITVGDGKQLSAKLSVGKGVFTWESSDETIAAVSANGYVQTKEVGTCVITASFGEMKKTCAVSVVLPDGYPVITGVDGNIDLFEGKTWQLTPAVYFNGEGVAAEFNYVSANEKVATIDSEGNIVGVKEGTCEITVTAVYSNFTAAKKVQVNVYGKMMYETDGEAAEVYLIEDSDKGYETTATLAFRAIYDLSDVTANIAGVEWSSDDTSIVAISGATTLSGKKVATIVAKAYGKTSVRCAFTYNGESYVKSFGVTTKKAAYTMENALCYDGKGMQNGRIVLPLTLPTGLENTSAFAATMDGEKLTFVEYNESGEFVFEAPDNAAKGTKEICLTDEKWELTLPDALYCTAVLTQSSHAELSAGGTLLAGELYALGEDIDVGYSSSQGAIQVLGTLDGRGHTIKGIELSEKPAAGWEADPDDGSQSYTAYISANSGTIRNLRIDFTVTKFVGGNSPTFTAPIYKNSGTLQNVLAVATYNDNGWFASGLIGKNYGTVKNCITVLPDTNDQWRYRLVGFTCFFNGGTLTNCYTIGNEWAGQEDSDAAWLASGSQGVYMEAHEGGATVENWKGLGDMGELSDIEDFSAADGWATIWGKNENTVTFNGEEVNVIATTYITIKYAQEDGKQIVIDLPALTVDGVSVSGTPEVRFDNTSMRGVSIDGNTLRVKKGKIDYGEYTVRLVYDNMTFIAKGVQFVTKVFRNSDVSDGESLATYFKDTLNDDPFGYFVLGEDLDFKGEQTAGVIEFEGILDGNGYSINNLNIYYDAREDGWESYLFKTNDGIIRNIGLRYSLYCNGPKSSFVYVNNGEISNVYVEMTLTKSENYWYTAPLAIKNYGEIKNCVTELKVASGVNVGNQVRILVAENDTSGSVSYCYGITNGYIDTDKLYYEYAQRGEVAELYAYETNVELSAAASFAKGEGWSKYFRIEDGQFVFGNAE